MDAEDVSSHSLSPLLKACIYFVTYVQSFWFFIGCRPLFFHLLVGWSPAFPDDFRLLK